MKIRNRHFHFHFHWPALLLFFSESYPVQALPSIVAPGQSIVGEQIYGTQEVLGNVIDSNIRDGIQIIQQGGSAQNTVITKGMQIIEKGGYSSDVYLYDDYRINEGMIYNIGVGGQVNNATLYKGKMEVFMGGVVSGKVYLQNGSLIQIDITSDTRAMHLSLDKSEAFFHGGYLDTLAEYTIASINLREGIMTLYNLDLKGKPWFTRLNTTTLSGQGTFEIITDLASLKGDFLNISGSANGEFGIKVYDFGKTPLTDASLQIIQTGGGSATFTLLNKNQVVDVGTYQYYLVRMGKNGWALSPYQQDDIPDVDDPEDNRLPEENTDIVNPDENTPPDEDPDNKPVPPVPDEPDHGNKTVTPSAAAILAMSTVDNIISSEQMNTARGRLEEIRQVPHDTEVWGRFNNSRYNVKVIENANYRLKQNGIMLGIDATSETGSGSFTRGLFLAFDRATTDFSRGGGTGHVDAYTAGGYLSYADSNGYYGEGIVKFSRFINDINAFMNGGTAANGLFRATDMGLNIQTGKYFTLSRVYLAPYGAVTAFANHSDNTYQLSNGLKANNGIQRNLTSEIGINLGLPVMVYGNSIKPYAKAAALHETINSNHVTIANNRFTHRKGGARGLYQAGIDIRTKGNLSLHSDISYSKGKNLESPWAATLGAAWTF
ncbi:autotransporter outer membrane beta-barrel domain-containing protein [Erwinia tasmaniensis]|uniref:autotransporter outer membrane beta-barrel domain-containing protein n=1 Tax=Erwinia tasmaniensis TaxID=338565 RepID=UPI003A4E494C